MSESLFVKLQDRVTDSQEELENSALTQTPVLAFHLFNEVLKGSFLREEEENVHKLSKKSSIRFMGGMFSAYWIILEEQQDFFSSGTPCGWDSGAFIHSQNVFVIVKLLVHIDFQLRQLKMKLQR